MKTLLALFLTAVNALTAQVDNRPVFNSGNPPLMAYPQPPAVLASTNLGQAGTIYRTLQANAKCPKCGGVSIRIKSITVKENDRGFDYQFKCRKCAKQWATNDTFNVARVVPASVVPFNITLTGPYDDDFDTNSVMYVAATVQFADNECKIESSPNDLFNFSQSAKFACYPQDQPVGAFFFYPKNSTDDRFYRAINTPCEFTTAVARQSLPAKPLQKAIQRWRSKDGLKVGKELPTANPKLRLFVLEKATVPKNTPMPPLPQGLPIPHPKP